MIRLCDVAYVEKGHERQVLDLHLPPGAREPTPLVVFIPGGGFAEGGKENVPPGDLKQLLEAGIAVAAINYRYVQQAKLPAAHKDSARAVQFLRSKAKEWNIDKPRIGGFGVSAGAQLCMYLAFHDDLADPKSSDPVAQESTRLTCIAPGAGQISMDMDWWDKNVPNFMTKCTIRCTTAAGWNEKWFGTKDDIESAKVIADISAVSLIGKDAPPVSLNYAMAPDSEMPVEQKDADNWMTHHVVNGVELKNLCDKRGVECHLRYPGARVKYGNSVEFFKAKLLTDSEPR